MSAIRSRQYRSRVPLAPRPSPPAPRTPPPHASPPPPRPARRPRAGSHVRRRAAAGCIASTRRAPRSRSGTACRFRVLTLHLGGRGDVKAAVALPFVRGVQAGKPGELTQVTAVADSREGREAIETAEVRVSSATRTRLQASGWNAAGGGAERRRRLATATETERWEED
ncbi:uncharacterized protein A4U43_C02F21500 [Asparagus officinalis]|uniref:Uncharacterized protein n=1 Tax=Asparagus officinalis TaxID=4686 RepID=A0A5P1FKA0_ASPOF|nr:uncharacterized protein A4U43_C02F21500 [Asparagus officinalis]